MFRRSILSLNVVFKHVSSYLKFNSKPNFLCPLVSYSKSKSISNAYVPIWKNFSTITSKTYYAVLGVKPDATDEEIKQAYYALSKKYHPDLNVGNKKAESKILEINAAFEVLGNKTEKEKYDDKMFPKVWERNAFIYDHDPEQETPDYSFRRIFKQKPLAYGPDQWVKHYKGSLKRKHRHRTQKCIYHKGQSNKALSKNYFN